QRLLFMQPSLQPPGGGNGVAAWMLEALKREYEVTVLTWVPVDLQAINTFYGTALRASEFRFLRVATAPRLLLGAVPLPLALLRNSLLMRRCKRIATDYDVFVTANNEADFGRPGIQYVHFPWAYRPRPPEDLRWYHGSAGTVRAYYNFCVRLSRFSR